MTADIPISGTKHIGGMRRLTGMNGTVRPIAIAMTRTIVLVVIAALLILVLLPEALAAQVSGG